jgi:hypothetical protein
MAKNSDKSLLFDERTKQSAYKEEVSFGVRVPSILNDCPR